MAARVSLALIVRDESEHLAECIQCFLPLEPEICVVDTGSGDDTVARAESLGARITHVVWTDDFATARNASLDMCTGDWILVIDADERVDTADLPQLHRHLNGPRDWSYRFTTRNYTSNPNVGDFQPCIAGDCWSRGFPGWFPSAKVRLFPNDPRIRFEGEVHELVNRSIARAGYAIATSEVPIHHYPLLRTPESIARKHALYLDLGRAKARRYPDDPRAHVELGHQYAEVADYAAAASAYRAALALQPADPETLKDLGGVLHLLGRTAEAQTALELAVRLKPDLRDAWRNLGVVHGANNAWERAARCFRQALRYDQGWVDGHRFLSVALERDGRLEEAAGEAHKALERMPDSLEAAENFVRLMQAIDRTDFARDLLDTLLVVRPDARGWRLGLDRLRNDNNPAS